jgi:hypothetical protein
MYADLLDAGSDVGVPCYSPETKAIISFRALVACILYHQGYAREYNAALSMLYTYPEWMKSVRL